MAAHNVNNMITSSEAVDKGERWRRGEENSRGVLSGTDTAFQDATKNKNKGNKSHQEQRTKE